MEWTPTVPLEVDHQPMSFLGEWIALQPLVQRIHEDDEEQRSEWVALSQAALHIERLRHAECCANARGEACEAVRDEFDKGMWHAQAMHGADQHLGLHRVVCLLDVVEERVQLSLVRGSSPTHRVARRWTL